MHPARPGRQRDTGRAREGEGGRWLARWVLLSALLGGSLHAEGPQSQRNSRVETGASAPATAPASALASGSGSGSGSGPGSGASSTQRLEAGALNAPSPPVVSEQGIVSEVVEPAEPPFHPFLPAPFTQGRSVGTTRDGYLVMGQPLPLPHEGLRVMDRQLSHNLVYGTSGLIDALVDVAAVVHQAHPGSVLSLGHLSAQFGGDIPWSVSHNAGRDADIAFFYQDKAGQDVVPQDFITLNSRGRSDDGSVRFDAARTWTVVRTLLLNSEIEVQWLFISTPLRAALLAHARALEESPELIARAEEVLGQPGDGRPHNDHLHLRILCSNEDLAEGCQDVGRMPAGVRPPEPVVQARILEVRGALTHPDPEFKARAAELLGILRDVESWKALMGSLDDRQPRVRIGAARGLELLLPWRGHETVKLPEPGGQALPPGGTPDETDVSMTASDGEEGGQEHGPDEGPTVDEALAQSSLETALLERLPRETDPTVMEVWVAILVRLRSPGLMPLLERWLGDGRWFAPETRVTFPGGGMPRDGFAGAPWLASRGVPARLPLPLRGLAAVALAELGDWSALSRISGLRQDASPEVQQAALFAVSLLVNQPLSGSEAGAGLQGRLDTDRVDTGRLETEGGGLKAGDRESALLAGFRAAGFPMTRLDARAVPLLVRALDGPMPQALNAALLLERLTGVRADHLPRTFEDVQVFWARYLKRNLWKYQPAQPHKAGKGSKAGKAGKGSKAGKGNKAGKAGKGNKAGKAVKGNKAGKASKAAKSTGSHRSRR